MRVDVAGAAPLGSRGQRIGQVIHTNVLILGGGVAGLRAAIAAGQRGAAVMVVSKNLLRSSATQFAQGGIAAATTAPDSPAHHAQDTLQAGCGLCEYEVVRHVINAAPSHICELLEWGAQFDLCAGKLDLGREGGHGAARVVHANGDATGAEIMRTLIQRARDEPRVLIIEQAFALDLLTSAGRVAGAALHHSRFGLAHVLADCTILATGGAGCVYRTTSNPAAATGDGIAIALRAGAILHDMEMVQFHPTTLALPGAPAALISEAVRGEGAYLVTRDGRRFMLEHDPRGELAPRDLVSRAVVRALRSHGSVYLDCRHWSEGHFRGRFPGIYDVLQQHGLDPAADLIPVRPAAHYLVGGVRTDLHARTSLPGLLACGECASSGLHGANRLASNSLLEGLVLGKRAGEVAAECASTPMHALGHRDEADASARSTDRREGLNDGEISNMTAELGGAMEQLCGIERDGKSLSQLRALLETLTQRIAAQPAREPRGWELRNLAQVATAIAACAAFRTESRGVHFRRDFPRVALEAVHTSCRMAEAGLHIAAAPRLSAEPANQAAPRSRYAVAPRPENVPPPPAAAVDAPTRARAPS